LRAHAAGDPSYATIAACIRTLADWKAPDLNALLAGALGEPSTNGVIASAALFAYSVRDGAAAIPLETGFARYGAPLDSRGAAIDALSRIGAGHPAVTKFLESLIGDPDFRTNLAVLHGLSRLGDPSAIPALLRYAQTEQDDRLKSVALDAAAALRAPHHAGGGMSGNGR
ncbi:MAG TPA: HEAT repeat domain-containing protein, partial [Candidatus Eremiobacteraceae bacterium]|nr:HEAT repeat domain-containing protein [Candidatus Eremiobacteraceae bacterium]